MKSDHEYDDLEIKKLGKRSSGALASSTPQLQQQLQHNSVLGHASNVQVTHLQAPTVPSRRQSIRIANRHCAVPPQFGQETVHTTNIQQPHKRVRYSLRPRVIIQEEMDIASNVLHLKQHDTLLFLKFFFCSRQMN